MPRQLGRGLSGKAWCQRTSQRLFLKEEAQISVGFFSQASLGCEIHSLELKMFKALLLWGPWGLGRTNGETVTRGTAGGAGDGSSISPRV